jgi:Inosine-uridine nucleoside N-ribohydrolase
MIHRFPKKLPLFLASCLLATAHLSHGASPAPVKLIFDTDYSTDCDDPGALAVLHALADNGEVEILATGASTSMAKAPGAIDVVNTYYGRPDLPIGATKKSVSYFSNYVDYLFDHFPHDTPLSAEVPDAVEVYRRILAEQPDDSVVFVTVGYLTNMAELLKSAPDAHSPLSGRELVALKVKEWACMGGNFFHDSTNNVNFTRDKESAYYAIRNFPKPLTFLPREVASEPSPLRAGQELTETPADNPVLVAYQKYFGRLTGLDRHVADPATVLYAVRGAHDYWDLVTAGWMDIRPDGTFVWNPEGEPSPDGTMNHRYLRMKGGYGVYSNKDYVEGVIRALLKKAPGSVGDDPDEIEHSPTPVPGVVAWYRFEESPGEGDPGAAIVNHGDAGSLLNLVNTGGPDGRDNVGAGGYGAPGPDGRGHAFDVLASGDGVYHSASDGSPTGGGLTTSASVPQSALQGADGAFTYEALVKVPGIQAEQTILAHDGASTRGFLFRIQNGRLSFYTGAGSITAEIPTSGPHAFAADRWFHVAITYDGREGTADNVCFYWTSLSATPRPTAANLVGTATLAADLPGGVMNLLGVGTTTRSPFRFELAGLIDEVGISARARTAEELASFGAPSNADMADVDGDGLPDAWEIANGMEAGENNRFGDPDGDGIPNLLEFALGLDPMRPDVEGLPVLSLEDSFLTLTALRNPEAADLLFTAEISGDLVTWSSQPDQVVVLENTSDLFRARDAEVFGASPRRFMRLRVE